jgi:hypothetical protein
MMRSMMIAILAGSWRRRLASRTRLAAGQTASASFTGAGNFFTSLTSRAGWPVGQCRTDVVRVR